MPHDVFFLQTHCHLVLYPTLQNSCPALFFSRCMKSIHRERTVVEPKKHTDNFKLGTQLIDHFRYTENLWTDGQRTLLTLEQSEHDGRKRIQLSNMGVELNVRL